MKRSFLMLCALCLCMLLQAQGRRSGQSAVHAEYGYILDKGELTGGFMAKAGYSKVFGEKGLLGKAEAFYQDYKVNYIDEQVLPYQKYGVNVNAGYSYEGLAPIYLNGWLGGYAAYETVNNGNLRDPKYNAEFPVPVENFVFGLSGSAELEYAFARRFSLLANYTQFYDLKSDFSKSNFALFGGIKYYIN